MNVVIIYQLYSIIKVMQKSYQNHDRLQRFIDMKTKKKEQSPMVQLIQRSERSQRPRQKNDYEFLSEFQYKSSSTKSLNTSSLSSLNLSDILYNNNKQTNLYNSPIMKKDILSNGLSISNHINDSCSFYKSKQKPAFNSQQYSTSQNKSNKNILINNTQSIRNKSNKSDFSIDSSNFPYQDYSQEYSHNCYSINGNNYFNEKENSQQSYSYSNFKPNQTKSPISISMKKNKHKCSQSKSRSYQRKRLIKQKQIEQNQCSICLDKIIKRSKLPCKHQFCLQCLTQWMQQSSLCPYCRAPASYYMYQGQKYEVQEKEFQAESDDELLDYVCYNCDLTRPGDIILICDRCNVNASHIECDQSLNGRMPDQDEQWYCYQCIGEQLQI